MKKITSIVVIASLILILGYDCYALMMGGTEATISHMLIVGSYSYPLIPFFGGFLMGHLFWRLRDTKETPALGRGD